MIRFLNETHLQCMYGIYCLKFEMNVYNFETFRAARLIGSYEFLTPPPPPPNIPPPPPTPPPTRIVPSHRYSPSGDLVVSTGEDASLRVWDAYSGAEVFTVSGLPGPTFPGLADPYHGERPCHFAADGQTVITGSEDGVLQVFDLNGVQVIIFFAFLLKEIWQLSIIHTVVIGRILTRHL